MNNSVARAKKSRIKKAKSEGLLRALKEREGQWCHIDEKETRGQIGGLTLAAINGGRSEMLTPGTMRLPMKDGYAVEISLECDDLYTVRRTFTKAGIRVVKGSQNDVYFMEVSEVAYQASLWRMGDWGDLDIYESDPELVSSS